MQQVLVEVTVISPPENSSSNHNGTVDSIGQRMTVWSLRRASKDYRSIADCYEWMFTLRLNDHDPLMFDAASDINISNDSLPFIPPTTVAVAETAAEEVVSDEIIKKKLSLQQLVTILHGEQREQADSDEQDDDDNEVNTLDFQQSIHADDSHA